ncbi:MAG TPA: cytochrome c [Pirellulales bacterium]|nr:cytochrome c [Pirellulales bacterium]
MRVSDLAIAFGLGIAVSLGTAPRFLQSEPPAIPKISEFAPSGDLVEQVDFFVGRIEQTLADPADFDLAKQSRAFKDGNTLAALALILAYSNQEHPLKASMPRLLKGAQALAAAEDNVVRAQAALAEIHAARAGSTDPLATVKWERVASLGALMKQVPLIHAGLKRGVEGNRLARQAVQSAGQSAALAAIAQASMLDSEYVKRPADIEKWQRLCAQMRDAAGEVNSAVHAQDPQRVTAGMKRLAQSCDACHAVFRSE